MSSGPQLRPGYIPIPVIHEGIPEHYLQKVHYAPQQPDLQRLKSEVRPHSPLRAQSPSRLPARADSPVGSPLEATQADKQSGRASAAAANQPQGSEVICLFSSRFHFVVRLLSNTWQALSETQDKLSCQSLKATVGKMISKLANHSQEDLF